MILGAEPEAVTAHAAVSALHGGIDMSTSLLLEFPGGVGVTAQVGMWNADQDTVSIIGSRGRIDVPHAFICAPEQGDIRLTRGDVVEVIAAEQIDHYERQVTRFADAVRGDATLRFDPVDAVRQAQVMEAATRSWRDRVRVALD
jgi:predicted dehydrogenase